MHPSLYQVPRVHKSNPNNGLGIYEEDCEGITYTQQSLDRFFADFTPYIPQGTHQTLAFIDGGIALPRITNTSDPFRDQGEAELDLKTAYPLINPQKSLFSGWGTRFNCRPKQSSCLTIS